VSRDGREVEGEVIRRWERVVEFRPARALEEGAAYRLTLGSGLRGRDGAEFASLAMNFRVGAREEEAELESAEWVAWQGRPLLRLRFTAAPGALADTGLVFEREGRAVAARVAAGTDPRELWVELEEARPVTVSSVGAMSRSGRAMAFRRLEVDRP